MKNTTKQIIENLESSNRKLGVWLKLLEESRNSTERDFAMRGLEQALEQLPQNIQEEARLFINHAGYVH